MMLTFNGTEVPCEKGDSVLDAVQRAGYQLDSGCRAGTCQRCIVKAVDGLPSAEAQVGLSSQQSEAGLFLACRESAYANRSLNVLSAPVEDKMPELHKAFVVKKKSVNADICLLGLRTEAPYKSGQYVMLKGPDDVVRPYSVASSEQGFVELHIKKVQGGAVSGWLVDNLKEGDEISISAGMGDCIYDRGLADKPLLLVGVGTGIAPIIGFLRSAYQSGYVGRATVVHGARDAGGLYASEHLNELSRNGATTLQLALAEGGDIYNAAVKQMQLLGECQVILCGAQNFVGKMKRLLFLGGAPLRNIKSEAFG